MTQRIFIPGSAWLYFKIYTGYRTADDILLKLYQYVNNLVELKAIDRYFFVRYADPEFHIRLRIHIKDLKHYGEIFYLFSQYFQQFIDNGQLIKIQCDTYNREIERYGTYTIDWFEELFYIDSNAILKLLYQSVALPPNIKDLWRWQLSLLLLDDTLTAFACDLEQKAQLMNRIADSFKQEFGFTTHTYTKQLNDKYRTFCKDIEVEMLTRKSFINYEETLQYRRDQITVIASKIKKINIDYKIPTFISEMIYNILHMTMNRCFRAQNRLHELIIYDFLNKYYNSRLARQ